MNDKLTNQVQVSIGQIHEGILHEEMLAAKNIRNEAGDIFNSMMMDTPREQIADQSVVMLEKLQAFEDNIINFEILNFLYSTIARTALNAGDYKKTFSYAKAGIEVNDAHNDSEGVIVNATVLIDAACSMSAFKSALKLIREYPEAEQPNIVNIITSMKSENDDLFQKMFSLDKRPTSLAICLDERRRQEERAIRGVMRQMGISRKEALKYKKEAESINPKNFM